MADRKFGDANFMEVPGFDNERTGRQRTVKVTNVNLVLSCDRQKTIYLQNGGHLHTSLS